jgi:hypothetical protein
MNFLVPPLGYNGGCDQREAVNCVTEECLNSLAVSQRGLNLAALCLSDPTPGFSRRQYSLLKDRHPVP